MLAFYPGPNPLTVQIIRKISTAFCVIEIQIIHRRKFYTLKKR